MLGVLYLFVLSLMVCLLSRYLLVVALALSLFSLLGIYRDGVKKRNRLNALTLMKMNSTQQLNICLNHVWINQVKITRKLFLANIVYCVFQYQGEKSSKPIGIWLFRDNFFSEKDWRHFAQFLALSV